MWKTFVGLSVPTIGLIMPEIWRDQFDWLRSTRYWPYLQVLFVAWFLVVALSALPWARLYRWRIQYARVFIAIAALTGALLAALAAYAFPRVWAPKPIWSVVSVSPETIPLHNGKWVQFTQLTVTNTGPDVLYAVSVDIEPVETNVNIKAVPDRDPNSIKVPIRGPNGSLVEMDADVMALVYTDGSHVLTFYQLVPGRPRHITVSGETAVKSSARVKVLSASTEPNPVLWQPAQPPSTNNP